MADNKLKKYHSKRDFFVTNEPKGKIARSNRQNLKFSVQLHAARSEHYDFRLELDGVALSWAVPKGPSFCTSDKRLAMRVEDHPVDYMDFEGIIPKGQYGGGTVMLWDEGEWIPRMNAEKGLKEGSLKFRLDGQRLKGDWALVRMKSDESSEPWLLIKERDEFAKKTSGITRFKRGVRSGKSMAEIAKSGTENPFKSADVMLAELCEKLPAEKGWLFELKYDGHRTLGFVEGGKVALRTRNGHDCTDAFSVAAKALGDALKDRAAVVDGEMVVVGEDGVPDFGALQAYLRSREKKGLCYVLFDLLALDGEDLRDRPLLERKLKLKTLLSKADPVLSYSEHTQKMTKTELEAVKQRGMEGIVAKRADSPYAAGKNGDWRKLKFRNLREFVIGGYAQSEAGRLRSLLVGFYEGDSLKFAGSVGTGFSEVSRRTLKEKLDAHSRKSSPFSSIPKGYQKGAVWVEPALATQVEYAEITSAGLLRQASFKGLRTDKPVNEITDERPSAKQKAKDSETKFLNVRITHPEKVMFPRQGITKLELAKYYAAVASRMLPLIKDRVLSLVCCPSGIEEEKFFRKHLEGDFPGIGYVPASDGESENFYLKDEKGILSLVQYNAVEFHIRGSKKGAERPDVMVFDLDPDEGLPLADIRKGARQIKNVLDGLGLQSFLKTSGGKGYHIVVPFRLGVDAQTFRDFSRGVAEVMENNYPTKFTSSISKKAREGKIFIDWQRNSPSATSAAPYSVRARDGAPVSMPISWEELGKVAPDSVTIKSALKRLEKPDPWSDFFAVKAKQSLKIKK